jgi:hypothetical protein
MGGMPDTKIFSVAVESRPTEHHANDVMVISDVDTDFTGRFAVVSNAPAKKTTQHQHQHYHHHHHHEKPSKKNVQVPVEKVEPKKSVPSVLTPQVAAAPVVVEEEPVKPTTGNGNGKTGKSGKGKKNKKGRSSAEESGSESSTSNVASKSNNDDVKTGFDFVPLKSDDFTREITPKVDDEEVFELTSNNNAALFADTTEDLLADALLSVVDDEAKHCASVQNTDRAISPTPSEDFTEMKSAKVDENVDDNDDEVEEEESFFVREKKSTSPETDDEEEEDAAPANLVASPKMVSCFEEMFGPVAGNSIVKSIEFATRLYGDDNEGDQEQDEEEEEEEDEEKEVEKDKSPSRLFNRSKKKDSVADSSEDDVEFKPVPRRQKRSKKKDEDNMPGTPGSSYADSESSMIDDCPMPPCEKQEGWSFEADDLDISKLIAEVVNHQQQKNLESLAASVASGVEEKTALDDIFKFDSELVSSRHRNDDNYDNDDDDNDAEDEKSSNVATTTTDDSENDYQVTSAEKCSKKVMSTSLNVAYEEAASSDSNLRGATSLTQSLVCGGSTSAESSSVGNSPNPKKNKNKSKRKKRR